MTSSGTEESAEKWGGGAFLESLLMEYIVPRERPIKIRSLEEKTLGRPFGPELGTWIELFEEYEMEVCDPADAELRAPGGAISLRSLVETHGVSWLADFIGFFTASCVVMQQDEMSYLASLAATPSGASKTYYFHPSDWGLWPTEGSLTSRIYRMLEAEGLSPEAHGDTIASFEEQAQQERLPEHWDPALLFPRLDWMIHFLLGVGQLWPAELERAAPLSVFEQERAALADTPHLASYWLWAHFACGNEEELDEVMTATDAVEHPVVKESRAIIRTLRQRKQTRLGDRDTEGFRGLCEQIVQHAPTELFGQGAIKRQQKSNEERLERTGEEHETLASLTSTAEQDKKLKEALDLLHALEQGGTSLPETDGASKEAQIIRLAEIVDARFRPLILARLSRSLRHEDNEKDASQGVILSWAALARDFEEFHAVMVQHGTKNLGPSRLIELYKAYGRFDDPRATDILAQGARSWLSEVDDWIRKVPAEPVLQLIKRDTLKTHEVISLVLERATFSPTNREVCIAVAVAAGKLKSRHAVVGLKRAIRAQLGRFDDGTRPAVLFAFSQAAGSDSLAFLREQLKERTSELERADEDDQRSLSLETTSLIAAMLPHTDDPELASEAKDLLERIGTRLEERASAQRPQPKDLIGVAMALVRGIGLGEIRSLAPDLDALLERLSSGDFPHTDLLELVRQVSKELAR